MLARYCSNNIIVLCGNISMTEYFLAGHGLVLISEGQCEEESVKSKLMHWLYECIHV